MPSRLSTMLFAAILGGCSFSRTPAAISLHPVLTVEAADPAALAPDEVLTARSTERVAELKSLGGECAAYGSVLESSILDGRVTVRPYMWRVGSRLVSGEARSSGDIIVARHIDAMNVGVRTVDDMVRTLEHEAAHVAFRVANGPAGIVDHANDIVDACRGNDVRSVGVTHMLEPVRRR